MIKAQCDKCGNQEETRGTCLAINVGNLPSNKALLPDDWRRIKFPMPDGSAWDKELCPACVRDLWTWLGVDVPEPEKPSVVRGLLKSRKD